MMAGFMGGVGKGREEYREEVRNRVGKGRAREEVEEVR